MDSAGNKYTIDLISFAGNDCVGDCERSGGITSYERSGGVEVISDGIGDACDCDAEGLCTAMDYCDSQETPDPDCCQGTDDDNDLYTTSESDVGKQCCNGQTCITVDCDDEDETTYPGASDNVCDGIDHNCNGIMNDGFIGEPVTFDDYVDTTWKNTDQTITLTANPACEFVPITETKYCVASATVTPFLSGTASILSDYHGTMIASPAIANYYNSGGTNGMYNYKWKWTSGDYSGQEYTIYGCGSNSNYKGGGCRLSMPYGSYNPQGWTFEIYDPNSQSGCTPDTIGIAITINQDGDYRVSYQSKDSNGNTETKKSINVKLDKTAPITIDDNAFNNNWTNLISTTVSLIATDNLAGVKQTDYSINGAPGVYSAPLTLNADGVYNLVYHSTDNANNQETEKITIVKLDATAPKINLTVTPKSWASCAGGGFFFWLVWFVDSGQVTYPLVHGCNEINANIDASISGLNNYNIKLYDQNNNLVASSQDSGIDFNFETSMSTYKIVVEATDKANNYATEALIVYEDDDQDYIPDNLDLCPTIKPSVDANKDGCPDEPGVPGTSWEKCISIYTGSAITSLNPINALNTFTDTIVKGDKTWYGFNSAISNINAVSYINMKVEDNAVTHCDFDLRTVDSTTEKGKKRYNAIDKDMKIREENKTYNYNLQETWKLDLDDGSKIRANAHYNMQESKSKIHIAYENKNKEKVCSDICEATKKSCSAACSALPKASQKSCNDNCNANEKACKNNCRDTYTFNVHQEYSVIKTLSLYDLMKMIGYA
jgi:hypothetical protein